MKGHQIFRGSLQFAMVAALACSLSGCLALSGSGGSGTGGNSGSPPATGGGTAGPPPVPSTPGPNNGSTGDISAINHIVFMSQENRSFDTYFGHLNDYRASVGLPTDVDGMPANASNPAFDGTIVNAFHLKTMCVENTSADWATSHINFNRFNETSDTPTMDGFVVQAAAAANGQGSKDTVGARAMGYYTAADIPYYYFMASQFATSDRWFAPAPTETEANRLYLVAATSVGHVHRPTVQVSAKTIFDLLDTKNISYKIYYMDPQLDTELDDFSGFMAGHQSKFAPLAQYFTDLQNGTLPQVSYIEPGFTDGNDEHPGLGNDIQDGAAETAKIINALMASSAWKDSAFILVYDEGGGFYDHVPPPTTVPSPDGIPPQDLITTNPPDPKGDFTRYGFRVPMMVVSPFTKKNYVSHTVTDSTAVLKMIESRFGLPNLNHRDAAGMDMSEFFDFKTKPWATPPTPPAQPTNGPCTDTLP
jgi:phospholipase C